jgi:hypothetical protein
MTLRARISSPVRILGGVLEEIAATVAVLIVTPGWAIALLAISAYLWKWIMSNSK